MKYALYVMKNKYRWMRIDEFYKNRKGLLTSRGKVYDSIEDAEAEAQRYVGHGYETKIKEIKR